MHHFFIDETNILGEDILIFDEEVKHIRDVLRMKESEKVLVSDSKGSDYLCELISFEDKSIRFRVLEKFKTKSELGSKIVLYQGLPKSDKMELIIEKCVELGITDIVPMKTIRDVVKLDNEKADKKVERWQAISKSAAKQSKRNIIPKVHKLISFKEALEQSKYFKHKFLAYENAKGIKYTKYCIDNIKKEEEIAIFVGSEGGFSEEEIALAKTYNINLLSLGNRILRTETAGFTFLSLIMFHLEQINE